MNAKKAKKLRRQADKYTPHLDHTRYIPGKTARLGECTKGAYRALKSGKVRSGFDS